MQQLQSELSLEQAIGALRRRWWWLVLSVLVLAGAAFGASKAEKKQYTATAAIVFQDTDLSQQVAGLSVNEPSDLTPVQDTDLKLVTLGDMATKTAAAIGHGLTARVIKSELSVSQVDGSNVIDVGVTSESPALAARIANSYVSTFVSEQANQNEAYYKHALAVIEQQIAAMPKSERIGASGLTLESRAQSLAVLAGLQSGNVSVVQAAQAPQGPSSPKVFRNTVVGALLGFILGLAAVFLRARFDMRITEPEDLERLYDLPLLGVIPDASSLAKPGLGPNASNQPDPGTTEAFQLMRAHLRYFNVDRDLKIVLVTSAGPGDGKTTVSSNLAKAAAGLGSKVLLAEGDMRRPTLSRKLGIQPEGGLVSVLIGQSSLADTVQRVSLENSGGEATEESRYLDVLPVGLPLPPNPTELMESQAMQSLLSEARDTYDLVVIDTPPLTVVSDAIPLLRKVDGVIVVGRVGRNRRDMASRLRDILTAAGAPTLGVVANGVKSRGGSYAYNYGYYAPNANETTQS